MSKHLLLDVLALANEGKTREQIAETLGVSVQSISNRLAYAKRKGMEFTIPPRKKRVAKEVA